MAKLKTFTVSITRTRTFVQRDMVEIQARSEQHAWELSEQFENPLDHTWPAIDLIYDEAGDEVSINWVEANR